MAILNLGRYWHRLGASPADAPAHADGRRAIPAHLQAALDDGIIRSTRTTPGYEGRHRAERRCACGQMDCQGHAWTAEDVAEFGVVQSTTNRASAVVEQPGGGA